jgi:hypothetical protein
MFVQTAKIQDYAVIGDGRSAALISSRGSIDWLCCPRFDSASIFAVIVDPKVGGHWSIHPAQDFQTTRRDIDCDFWFFFIIYVSAFQMLQRSTRWLGAVIALVQAILVLTMAFPILPALYPRMANEQHGPTVVRQLEPPGFFGMHYGIRTPISILTTHAIFGAILGAFYTIK